MAVPHILAGTAGGTTVQLDANWAYFADAITVSAGSVGVGTSALDLRATISRAAVAGTASVLSLNNPHPYGSGVGTATAGLRFNRSPSGGAASGIMAEIHGGNENESTSSSGYLSFAVRSGAPEVATERMRLDSGGNVITTPPVAPPTLATNGQMVMNLTSNTNLRISARGSDGVTRVANITLA